MSFWLKSLAWVFRAFGFLFLLLPKKLRFLFGDFLGILWFDVFRIRRDVVLANLKKAFPEWTEEERIRIGRRSLFHLGRDLIEYCELPNLTLEKVKQTFVIEGWENLEKARAQGKGVSLLTLHLGNGDFAIAGLSVLGVPMYLISKEFKLKWLNDLWFGMRARLGTHFIPPRNSSYSVLKALKKQNCVVFVLDQFTGPPIGVKTTFFGHETGTGAGLATIAERSGCPVVPVYTYRKDEKTHVIHFDPEIPYSPSADKDQGITETTQRYNDVLEAYVRKCPEQWMWIHKRWKIRTDY